MSGQVARTGKDAVFGDGVLWGTGWRAGHEGVPSQDATLVFQGVLPAAADFTNCPVDDWRIPADAMIQPTISEFVLLERIIEFALFSTEDERKEYECRTLSCGKPLFKD